MSADKVLTFKFPVFKNGNKPIVYLLDIKVNKEIFNKIDKKIKHSGSIGYWVWTYNAVNRLIF